MNGMRAQRPSYASPAPSKGKAVRNSGRLWFSCLCITVLTVILAIGFGLMRGREAGHFFPLKKLVIESRFQQLSAEQIRAAASESLNTGFFSVNLAAARAALQSLPWVEQVEVRKVWPDTIVVRVFERHAVARWGKNALLSERGDAFLAEGAADMSGLVRLSGPELRKAELLAFYQTNKTNLQTLSLHMTHAHFSRRGALTVRLSDGSKIILGREQQNERWTRLLENLPTLRAKNPGRNLVEVDMRYTNGLAARFSDPNPKPDTPAPTKATPPPSTDARAPTLAAAPLTLGAR